ncbi:hypothetical protein BC830DRAFT_146270 [Chytriomyces sp. MP71]|nr:hypothetical protein BC830DRAFT_146270 [Chytriomyces sp. MP71]
MDNTCAAEHPRSGWQHIAVGNTWRLAAHSGWQHMCSCHPTHRTPNGHNPTKN